MHRTQKLRCILIMKKFLSLALASMVVLATASIAAYAEAPKAADYKANNGFFIYEGKSNPTEVQDPADVSDTDKGMKVVHGGYYASGDNCGGVVSNEKYDLNGFEATVYFEKAPEVTTDTDCWVAMDFLVAPRAFYTGNFDPETGNQGILDLIRFGKPYLEIYEGISGFSGVYNTQGVDASINNMFSITSGTTLTVKLARNENGSYKMTFAREGFDDFEVPYEFPMADVFPDGKAHFSVIASCEIAPADGWTYYITDVKNGVEMTEEEIAAIAKAKEEAEIAAKVEEATKETDKAEEKANEAMTKAEEAGSEDAKAKAQEAIDAIAASRAAIEEHNFEEAQAQSDLARDYAKEANDLSKEATKGTDETKTGDTSNTENTENTEVKAESNGISPIVWVIIAIVVVVVIVVIVVVAKKKK